MPLSSGLPMTRAVVGGNLSEFMFTKNIFCIKYISAAPYFRSILLRLLSHLESPMARGRPKGDESTCVLAVRIPLALRDDLDRYLDALETRVGLTASRNAVIRQALRQFLAAEP